MNIKCPGCKSLFNPVSKWGLKKYCNRHCVHIGSKKTEESKNKIRKTIIDKNLPSKKILNIKVCINPHCGKSFSVTVRQTRKFCNDLCRKSYYNTRRSHFENYKIKCQFRFSISDYPCLFDPTLIEKYGWYSPTNKHNNLNGISRDHRLSIKDGFDKNIDPKLISHPANCELVRHLDNQKKKTKSSISLEDLVKRICAVDREYEGSSLQN